MNQKQINKTTKMALVKEERHHLLLEGHAKSPCGSGCASFLFFLYLSSYSNVSCVFVFISVFSVFFHFICHCLCICPPLMPLPSGGGSAFFLLSLHARAACDESLRCSSVGSLRSPSRFHSDTCASSSAHTHTHTTIIGVQPLQCYCEFCS